jgi:hypothetical protein
MNEIQYQSFLEQNRKFSTAIYIFRKFNRANISNNRLGLTRLFFFLFIVLEATTQQFCRIRI